MKLEPNTKLEQGETVKYIFRRSAILNILIFAGEILATFALVAFLIYLGSLPLDNGFFFINDEIGRKSLYFIVGILYLVILLAGLISIHVNRSNILFITDRRIIQHVTTTLVAQSLNIISFRNIEDVSFKQSSILDHLFHIGQLRLSTVGDETTYTFPHIDSPSDDTLSQISNLISKSRRRRNENPMD